ncbi:helicase-associated domain-containing protein [Corynebacterium sp.]|uniref:helicase-associated domain-containing protein n=1 Tax=Corynebacterium sp. TaxID=1720 RepID=UPI0026E07C9C|nr:helicase-associated domain-containing protein [Corynebacterium sp.]MDO5513149.1 helicase-associated domain-containing protein [Corynebacterium sp.]
MSATPASPDFRTWLSDRDDLELANLLRARPDVALPIPPGITPLAARLQLRASVGRAVRTLTALELATIEAAANLGAELSAVPREEIIAAVPASDPLVEAALDHLRSLALIYGDDAALRVTPEAMASLPADWQLLDDSPTTPSLPLEDLSEKQRAILDTLLHSGGVGRTRHADADADPTHPIPQLIAGGLLVRVDSGTVRLPRRVRAALLGREIPRHPLSPSARVRGQMLADDRARDRADQGGAAAGLEVARHLRHLIEHLGAEPAPLLKEGGVGVRAVTALARTLDVPEDRIHRLVALGSAAGLLARGEVDDVDVLAPTVAADDWLEADLATRWLTMTTGWLQSPWAPWLVGTPDERKSPIRLLADAMHRPQLLEQRRMVISQYTHAPAGIEVSDAELREDFFFTHPIAATLMSEATVSALVEEARWIGLVAGGTATTLLRALLDPQADALATATEVTPGTVERLIPQGDMTVLAPGPLPRALQTELDLLGELESAGLASVYRLSDTSVRRALDAGRTAGQLKDWLADHTLGEVPQSILYLIDDVARRHGTLRGGPALSYLRCDDPALLAEAVRTPAAAEVALRLIAPTVAVAQAPLVRVIEQLRAAGFQPVAEDATGAALDIRPAPARLPARDIPTRRPQQLEESRIQAAVAAIRRHDAGESLTPEDTRTTLAILQAAARGGRSVTLGFVDKHGQAVHKTVTPLTVTGGQVDALDDVSGQVQRFMLHRITEVLLG